MCPQVHSRPSISQYINLAEVKRRGEERKGEKLEWKGGEEVEERWRGEERRGEERRGEERRRERERRE